MIAGSRVQAALAELQKTNSQDRVLIHQRIDVLVAAVDRMEGSMQESLVCLKNLQAPNFPYPHLVVVKKAETQGKKGLLSKLRSIGVKNMTLHFLCPVDMSTVPCGMNGEGYRFRETRGWVKKLAPVLQVNVVTARVALKATAGMDVDTSGFLEAFKNGLVEEVADSILDERALFRVVSGEEDADTGMREHVRASYEALKKFMDKETQSRLKSSDGGDVYVEIREKMERVSDGKGGMVWVRSENVR